MRISPRLIVATLSLLSALAIGCQQVDTSDPQGTSQSAAEANGQGAQQGGPSAAKAPSIPQLLLRESIEELKTNGALNAAVENIKQSLQGPEEQARSTQQALDKAVASQLRNGSVDTASLEAAISATEQAHRDADASVAQALEDARALLSAAQRKSVVERVKSKLPRPDQAPQGTAGEQPPPPDGQQPPPQGAPPGGEQAGPPPGGEQAGHSPGGEQGAPGAGMGPEGPDPLLQGIELSEEQKAQLKELMPPPKDGQAAPPPEGAQPGAPPGMDGAQPSAPPEGSAQPKGPPPGGDKVAADKLLEAFASDAEELPEPPAPPEGAISPLRHRMEFLANLAKVLTEEQREIVADRLEAGPPKPQAPAGN